MRHATTPHSPEPRPRLRRFLGSAAVAALVALGLPGAAEAQDTSQTAAAMDSATHAGDTLRAAGDTMAAGDTADTTGQPDIIHQQREVAPGIDRDPPPYPADSERVWVEERPSHDSVPVPNATLGDTAQSSQ